MPLETIKFSWRIKKDFLANKFYFVGEEKFCKFAYEMKDLGKGFTKGLGVGIPQLIINNIINDEEESIEESNEELVKHLQQQSTVNGDIVANI